MAEYSLGFKASNHLPMSESEQYEELIEQFEQSDDKIICKVCKNRETAFSVAAGLMLHVKGKALEVGYEFNTAYVRKIV